MDPLSPKQFTSKNLDVDCGPKAMQNREASPSSFGISPPTSHPKHFSMCPGSTSSVLPHSSTQPWVGSHGSGPRHDTTLFRLVFLRLRPPFNPNSARVVTAGSLGMCTPHQRFKTRCRHTVSGSISLPQVFTFLTVVHYRSLGHLGWEMVLPDLTGSRVPPY